jgi:hypothetical protein
MTPFCLAASGKCPLSSRRRQERVRTLDPAIGAGVHCRCPALEENSMRDVVFILITLAIFAVLALIARGVERM